ncbi:MAG: hypothetical protein K9H25_15185, partial [Rhodospirillum sp.]|nr:hypothetical protein [Rhodospirillum sp.]
MKDVSEHGLSRVLREATLPMAISSGIRAFGGAGVILAGVILGGVCQAPEAFARSPVESFTAIDGGHLPTIPVAVQIPE